MELEIGNEEKFKEFIKNLGGSNVALVSHTDLDGITCPKVVNEIVKTDEIIFVDYTDLNDNLVEKLKEKKIGKYIQFLDTLL